jgi:hypothetical protein
MKIRFLLGCAGMLALFGCGSDSSVAVENTDPETLKGSPAGLSIMGFLDIMTTVPGILGGSQPSCITSSLAGSTATLTLAGCPSATGGTLAGTITLADTPTTGRHTYVETFNSVVNTRSASLQWVYAGVLDAVVTTGGVSTLDARPGFKLTVTPTAPAASTPYDFACSLTGTTTSGGFTLQGSFSFAQGTTTNVGAVISPATPLTWATGAKYPSSGTLVITDNRPGITNRETVTAVFSQGSVNLNGGIIPLA